MARSVRLRPVERFLVNRKTKEVHDLRNEQVNCQINQILVAGHGVVFSPNSLEQAHLEGCDNGHYCIGGSKR